MNNTFIERQKRTILEIPEVITWAFDHNRKHVTNTCHSDTCLTIAHLYSYFDDEKFYK